MARTLDVVTLQEHARWLAANWHLPDRKSRNGKRFVSGRSFVLQELFNYDFKDEFELALRSDGGVLSRLGSADCAELEKLAKQHFKPRDEKVYQRLLREKLAIDPDGKHIEGAIGTVQLGVRPIRREVYEAETPASVKRRKALILAGEAKGIHVPGRTDRETYLKEMLTTWPVYAGELEERLAGNVTPIGQPGADELPEDAYATLPDGRRPEGVGANVTNISAAACILGIDAELDELDSGSTAAEIRWRTGAQPADPDASETGTLLGTNTMSDPAFLGASDDGDGSCSATADTVSDDSSADATGTAGYARMAATGTGADDVIDGNVATASAAFVVNTTAFVSGATISVTSVSYGRSQGSTAT